MAQNTTRKPSIGDRVSVACYDGYSLEPNGRFDFGTVYRITPFGAIDVHFDDNTYAVVAPSQVSVL